MTQITFFTNRIQAEQRSALRYEGRPAGEPRSLAEARVAAHASAAAARAAAPPAPSTTTQALFADAARTNQPPPPTVK